MAKENTEKNLNEEGKISLTQEELNAMLNKEAEKERQKIALAEAKEKAKKAVEEEALKNKQMALGVGNTIQILAKEKKFRVTVQASEGEKSSSITLSVNGVKYKINYGVPAILPASVVDLLENSVTFGKPKQIKTEDGYKSTPTFVRKRIFSKEAI